MTLVTGVCTAAATDVDNAVFTCIDAAATVDCKQATGTATAGVPAVFAAEVNETVSAKGFEAEIGK